MRHRNNREEKGRRRYLISRDREEQRKERWQRISESRYCAWYRNIKEEGVPKCLKKEWGESR